jgi:hypothetical protein
MFEQLKLTLLLFVIISIAGCLGATFEPIKETIQVPYDHCRPYELWGEKGVYFDIEIKTDGAPVDVLILNTENYIKYNKAFTEGISTKWNGIFHRDIVSKKFRFTLPESGTYYMIIENSKFTSDGADAKREVNIAVSIE